MFEFINTEDTMVMKGAKIAFKNFSGTQQKNGNKIINAEGNRNISIEIPADRKDVADLLVSEGFTVKADVGDDGNIYRWRIKAKISYDKKPPNIAIAEEDPSVPSGYRTTWLTEQSLNVLDNSDIISANINLYKHRYQDEAGDWTLKNAYVITLVANVVVDPVMAMYRQ